MGKIDNGIITELPRYKSGKVNYKAMVGLTLKWKVSEIPFAVADGMNDTMEI